MFGCTSMELEGSRGGAHWRRGTGSLLTLQPSSPPARARLRREPSGGRWRRAPRPWRSLPSSSAHPSPCRQSEGHKHLPPVRRSSSPSRHQKGARRQRALLSHGGGRSLPHLPPPSPPLHRARPPPPPAPSPLRLRPPAPPLPSTPREGEGESSEERERVSSRYGYGRGERGEPQQDARERGRWRVRRERREGREREAGRKRDAGRAAGRKREPGRGREEEGAERKSECLTIPRGEALNREKACAIESNAARYRLVIPFPNSFDNQTVALVAANSNSEFHPPMPTSKRTLSDFVVQFLACKRFLTRD